MPRTAAPRQATRPDRHRASPEDLDRIAGLVAQARPDWDTGLVKAVLYAHVDQVDGTDLAIAALRAAINHDLPRPAAIGWRGPHWRDLDTTPPQAQRPAKCAICGRAEPECWSARPGPRVGPAADDHPFEPVRS